METEVMSVPQTQTQVQTFTQAQVELISRSICPGATKDELSLFVAMCKRTALDPFSRQIYGMKVGGKLVTMISIDGFRLIAERSGSYAGQDEPRFEYDPQTKALTKCSVTVYRWRGDNRFAAAVGVAYWNEYAKPSSTWKTMPHTMLSKVAESIALRKAFPNDLSGLYAPEEMDQAQPVIQAVEKPIAATAPVEDTASKQSRAAELMNRGMDQAKTTKATIVTPEDESEAIITDLDHTFGVSSVTDEPVA